MDKLTQKDLETKEAIVSYIKEHGYAPSIRELCTILNVKSTSTIHLRLKKLKESGVIETDSAMSPRAIRVIGYKFVEE